jgi:hypothetical protein
MKIDIKSAICQRCGLPKVGVPDSNIPYCAPCGHLLPPTDDAEPVRIKRKRRLAVFSAIGVCLLVPLSLRYPLAAPAFLIVLIGLLGAIYIGARSR